MLPTSPTLTFAGFIDCVGVGSIRSDQIGNQSRRFKKVLLRDIATSSDLDMSHEVATASIEGYSIEGYLSNHTDKLNGEMSFSQHIAHFLLDIASPA